MQSVRFDQSSSQAFTFSRAFQPGLRSSPSAIEALSSPDTSGARVITCWTTWMWSRTPLDWVSSELKASIADGLERKPGWKALEKVKAWLEL